MNGQQMSADAIYAELLIATDEYMNFRRHALSQPVVTEKTVEELIVRADRVAAWVKVLEGKQILATRKILR